MVYLKEKGIIHRDLSLRNILVTSDPERKYLVKVQSNKSNPNDYQISDFGMSRATDSGYYRTDATTLPVKWSAPEAIEQHQFTSKSDVWSFGKVI